MKRLNLCKDCDAWIECNDSTVHCNEAIQHEAIDDTALHLPHSEYKAKGVTHSWTQQKRILQNNEF